MSIHKMSNKICTFQVHIIPISMFNKKKQGTIFDITKLYSNNLCLEEISSSSLCVPIQYTNSIDFSCKKDEYNYTSKINQKKYKHKLNKNRREA